MRKKLKAIIKFPLLFFYRNGLRLFGGLGLQKVWPLGMMRDWLSGAVRTYGRPESVSLRGATIFLDANDNLELSVWGDRHHAFREVELIEQSVRAGDTVIDVGANIGLMTVFMARAVGPTGRVFAFEPAPENVAVLKKNISANGLRNVTIVASAVSDAVGTLKLFLSDFNLGDHRIYDPEEKIRQWGKNDAVYDKLVGARRASVEVPVVSLDDFFKNRPRQIAFIKMDVQGAEGGVLEGMKDILKQNKNITLLSEFWPAGLAMFGAPAPVFLGTLAELGFSFYDLADMPLKAVSRERLLNAYTVENNRSTNLLIKR